MAEYVVLAFLDDTEEHHVEAESLDHALVRIREVVEKRGREWNAITLVHVEDYPRASYGLERQENEPTLWGGRNEL